MIRLLQTRSCIDQTLLALVVAVATVIGSGAPLATAATIATAKGSINEIAWSPDGSLMAVVSDSSTVTIAPIRRPTSRKIFQAPARVLGRSDKKIYDIAWMPDGRSLVCLTDESAEVWDAVHGNLIRQVPEEENSARVDVPVAKTAVFDSKRPPLHHVLLPGPQSVDEEMSISPSGRWLAIAHWDTNETIHDEFGDVRSYSTSGYVNVYDLATGKLHKSTSSVGARVLDAVWSADGGTIASRCGDTLTRIWDVRTGKVRRALRPGGFNLALSPDGAVLASNDTSRTRLWNTQSGKFLRSVATGDTIQIIFAPANFGAKSGYLLALTQNGVVLYNPRTGRRAARLPTRWASDISFAAPSSPWPGTIAFASGQTVRTWKP